MIRIGEMGVSAFSIILYIASLVIAIFSGICNGISPIISFNYGANNKDRINKILKIAILTIIIIGISSTILMIFGGETLIKMFSKGDAELIRITAEATKLYSVAFVFNGLNILTSAYFTALEDAKTSAIISVLRGVILILIFIIQQIDGNIIGPKILGDSIGISAFWILFAILVAGEFMGLVGMIIGVPVFAIIYSVIKEDVEYKLKNKDLPTETKDYMNKM